MRKAKTARRWWVMMVSLVVVLVVLSAGVGEYFYRQAIKRVDKPEKVEELEANRLRKEENRQWFEAQHKPLLLQSSRGFQLSGYEFLNPASDKWVIVVHGHTTEARRMANYIREFHNRGYNVLAMDLMGHGQSQGEYYSMGGYDSKDLRLWIEDLNQRHQAPPILLFGISMGGATVLNALDEDLPSNVKAFIEDSGYIRVNDVFGDQIQKRYGLPVFPFIPLASLATKLHAGYAFGDVDATMAIQQTKLPALILHGTADETCPIEFSEEVMSLLQGDKTLVTFEGIGHCRAEVLETKAYWEAIEQFLRRVF